MQYMRLAGLVLLFIAVVAGMAVVWCAADYAVCAVLVWGVGGETRDVRLAALGITAVLGLLAARGVLELIERCR